MSGPHGYTEIEDAALRAERAGDWLAATRCWLEGCRCATSWTVHRRCLELARAAFLRMPFEPEDGDQRVVAERFELELERGVIGRELIA